MTGNQDEIPPRDEIAERMREIRERWSPAEEQRRAGCFATQPYETPSYRVNCKSHKKLFDEGVPE